VWVITGVLTLTAALSYGELAGMFPQAGGQYVYLREAFGPLAGFLYGWTLFTVIQTGTIAAVGMAFAKYTAFFLPAVGESYVLLDLGVVRVNGAQALAISSILLLTLMNTRGVQLGKLIQNVFTTTKIVSVVALAVVGIVIGWNSEVFTLNWSTLTTGTAASSWTPLTASTPILFAVAVAMVGSVFSSDAWNNITFAAAEVRDPAKTIPRALMIGVTLVTLLYLACNVAYLGLLPLMGDPEGTTALARGISHATNDRVGAAAADVMFGTVGASVMAILIMISTFGCNNGLILSGSRAYFAMAADGLFFTKAASLNKRGVPATSLWIQAVWASALCLSGSYGDLLDYVVFAVLVFYVLTIAGIFHLRRTRPDIPRPVRAVGYPILPAIYIVGAVFICVALLIYKQQYTWPGLIIVASGIPVYLLWGRINAAR
jgi:APA family basic amino acid/polyamine antiporter